MKDISVPDPKHLFILFTVNYFSIYFTILIGFMGLSVTSAQLFMHFDRMKFTFLFSGLVVATMFILVAQISLVINCARRQERNQ